MSTTVIRLSSSPADLLSVVPHLLGFHPNLSLVLVCLTSHGRSAQLGMLARIDLPEAGHAANAVDALLPAVAREDPDSAVVIGYGTPDDHGTVAVEVLAGALAQVGVRVRDRLVVVDGRWQSLGSPTGRPGPWCPVATPPRRWSSRSQPGRPRRPPGPCWSNAARPVRAGTRSAVRAPD